MTDNQGLDCPRAIVSYLFSKKKESSEMETPEEY